MLLDELYNLIEEEVSYNLIGTVINEGIAIKWEYDSFNAELEIDESEDEHLEKIYFDDLEILKDTINLKDFHISDPTIEDTYISFYIEK
jgi:hypothetical protein